MATNTFSDTVQIQNNTDLSFLTNAEVDDGTSLYRGAANSLNFEYTGGDLIFKGLGGDSVSFRDSSNNVIASFPTAAGIAHVNQNNLDIDLRVQGDTDTNLLRTNAADNTVGIGENPGSTYKFSVTGDARVTGDLDVNGNIDGEGTNHTFGVTGQSTNIVINAGAAQVADFKFQSASVQRMSIRRDASADLDFRAFNGSGVYSHSPLKLPNSSSGTITIDNDLTVSDAHNIILNTTTGTKIGTGTTQKLGFWNATPVVQQSHIVDAVTNHSFSASYSDLELEDALDDMGNKVNEVLTLLETLGLVASS